MLVATVTMIVLMVALPVTVVAVFVATLLDNIVGFFSDTSSVVWEFTLTAFAIWELIKVAKVVGVKNTSDVGTFCFF